MTSRTATAPIRVDIVSDIVCPWCVIGFRQLDMALKLSGMTGHLRWHPFELNPDMPEAGQNLREHLAGKYRITPQQSDLARARLTTLGSELGFTFNFTADTRIVNTFRAHQLLDWAADAGRQTALKLALFRAYFTDRRDVSREDVLIAVADSAGLDPNAAGEVLGSGARKDAVREKQRFWTARGVSGVPTMIFGRKYLLTGAQGVPAYQAALERCLADAA